MLRLNGHLKPSYAFSFPSTRTREMIKLTSTAFQHSKIQSCRYSSSQDSRQGDNIQPRLSGMQCAIRWLRCTLSSAPKFTYYTLLGILGLRNTIEIQRKTFEQYKEIRRIFQIDMKIEDRNQGQYEENNKSGLVFVLLNQTSLSENFVILPAIHEAVLKHRQQDQDRADFYPFVFANLEYLLVPFHGWVTWLWSTMVIRQWSSQARSSLDKARDMVIRGHSCYISIEGKRNQDSQSLQPYKKGAAVLAIHSNNATIVPIFIKGASQVWPSGDWKVQPGDITVVFMKKISTKGMSYEDRTRLTDHLNTVAQQELLLSNKQQQPKSQP